MSPQGDGPPGRWAPTEISPWEMGPQGDGPPGKWGPQKTGLQGDGPLQRWAPPGKGAQGDGAPGRAETAQFDESQTVTGIACLRAKSLQLCPTLCNPMDCSPPGSSVHGILQARIQEWVAVPSSKGSSHRGIKPTSLMSPAMAGGLFITRATWEAQVMSHRQLGALGLHETGSDLSVQG